MLRGYIERAPPRCILGIIDPAWVDLCRGVFDPFSLAASIFVSEVDGLDSDSVCLFRAAYSYRRNVSTEKLVHSRAQIYCMAANAAFCLDLGCQMLWRGRLINTCVSR